MRSHQLKTDSSSVPASPHNSRAAIAKKDEKFSNLRIKLDYGIAILICMFEEVCFLPYVLVPIFPIFVLYRGRIEKQIASVRIAFFAEMV